MFKIMLSAAAASIAFVAPASAAQAAIGPDAGACSAGKPSVLVKVSGFKNHKGRLRVQLYGGDPSEFLAKGKKLRRIEVPVTAAAAAPVCIAVPKPGIYAVAVRHDADANGKSGWNDGGGFSRNPNISLTDLKPRHSQVAIPVGAGVKPINVVLNYRQGLSIGPVASN